MLIFSIGYLTKSSNNYRMSTSYNIYSLMIDIPCFNGPDFILTVLAIILSTLLSKILSRLSLYGL